ncbi:MAG TPA: hypothetical protein VI814_02815 [Candidatus Limnocylindria bacterium]
MAGDDDLVGIGIALVIVAAVMWFAFDGDIDAASAAWRLQQMAATVWSAVQSAAAAFGI